jgi:hypothetical protein
MDHVADVERKEAQTFLGDVAVAKMVRTRAMESAGSKGTGRRVTVGTRWIIGCWR